MHRLLWGVIAPTASLVIEPAVVSCRSERTSSAVVVIISLQHLHIHVYGVDILTSPDPATNRSRLCL